MCVQFHFTFNEEGTHLARTSCCYATRPLKSSGLPGSASGEAWIHVRQRWLGLEGDTEMNKIPSDEGLDRASKMMEQQFQGLDAVEAAVVNHFKNSCPLYDFCILPQGDDGFRAYIFFNTDEDIQKCTEAGIVEDIKACVYEELERAGRGKQGEIEVAFELDSHENVTANFEGNYFFRLR